MKYQIPKLFIGPVSKNVVDATIEYAEENHEILGLIPSRRQIDFDGGYVNGWTTKTFSEYVRNKTKLVLLERDHGGPDQGKNSDNGLKSFMEDGQYMDIIHIDPFKSPYRSFNQNIKETIYWLFKIDNPNVKFEIGTEEAIRGIEVDQLDKLLRIIHDALLDNITDRILYGVIQSGTSLKENSQTGIFDENRLRDFINVCKSHKLYSKEHNGDYLSAELIHKKFLMGLDSINIAPEFGMIETNCYINEIKEVDQPLLDVLYSICYRSNMWKKWVDSSFDVNDKEKLIKICGHYILSTQEFHDKIRSNLRNLDEDIKNKIKKRINEIVN